MALATRDVLGGMASARSLFDISPSDDDDLAVPARALNCSVAGVLKVIAVDDSVAVTITVTAGTNPYHVKKVFDTGSDSMTIVGVAQ